MAGSTIVDILLYHQSRREHKRRVTRFLALIACLMALLFSSACTVQRDPRNVESAALKSSRLWVKNDAGKGGVTAFNPIPPKAIAPAIAAASSGPILLDDEGEAPFNVPQLLGTKNAPSKRLLPALYLEELSTPNGSETRVEFVSDPTRRNTIPVSNFASPLKLDSYEIPIGGEIKGSIAAAAGEDSLQLLWVDEAGRVTAQQELVAPDAAAPKADAAGALAFTFKMPPGTFGHLHKLALVRVPKKDPAKVEAVEPFRIVEALTWDDYLVFSRDENMQRFFPPRAAKFSYALLNPENPLFLANFADTAASYARTRDAKQLERKPPILNETAIEKAIRAVEKNFAAKTAGLNLWSLGNGMELSNFSTPLDFDMSPETVTDYQTWLRDQRYGSLKTLNVQWHSDEKDWSKIVPRTTDSAKGRLNKTYATKIEMLQKGDPDGKLERRGNDPIFSIPPKDARVPGNENVADWADFRAYNDYAFASALNVFRRRAVALDPRAQSGLANIQYPSAWGGWEYGNLSRVLDWAEEHESVVAREILHGFNLRRDKPIHFISQTSGIEPAEVHRLWDRWLRGDSGCLLSAGAPGTLPALDDIGELTRGLTLLRNQARQHTDPIAIYYSPRSVYLHWMLDSEEDGSAWTLRDSRAGALRDTVHLQMKAWLMLLEDLGYSPYFIDPEAVAAGALKFPETKVVILPKVLALSKNEAGALRYFARAGGCVLADGECGTFDGVGIRRGGVVGPDAKAIGALDVDFGIARKDLRSNERDGRFRGDASAHVAIRTAKGLPAGPDSPELRLLEPGIIASGAVAHASTATNLKALFSQQAHEKGVSGKGRFFYLNLCLMDYPRLRAEKTAPGFTFTGMTPQAYAEKYGAPSGGEAIRLTISDILDEFAGENAMRIRDAGGAPIRGIKHASYEFEGGATLHALMPLADFGVENGKNVLLGAPLGETANALAGDGAKHFWYDTRAGEFLGESAEVKAKLQPNRPALLSALPYSADRMTLQVRRLTDNVFRVSAALQCSQGRPGTHVFHIEVADPAGNVMPWYAANCLAPNAMCNHEIAIGINDPAGMYHVKVRDVSTGKSAEGDLAKEAVGFTGLKFEEKK